LGRSVLALKLVTHLFCAASAAATLFLLRRCLSECGLHERRTRWTATIALVIALASAPRAVTIFSTYAVGNHAEGSAIDTLLLALFALRWHMRSSIRTALFWAVVGLALYLNKAVLLVVPALAVAELALSWRAPVRLLASLAGFCVGAAAEVQTVLLQLGAGWGYLGWTTMLAKEQRNARRFPEAFLNTIWFMSEHRPALLAAWFLSIAVAAALLIRACVAATAPTRLAGETRVDRHWPLSLGLTVGVSGLHLAALSAMAKNGLDAYVIYGYPTLVVAFALAVAVCHRRIVELWGDRAGVWGGVGLVLATLLLYRPDAMALGGTDVRAMWRNRAGAACSWRFAEGFEREVEYGLAPGGRTREGHAIVRCRSLSEESQRLDCIGGIARELQWRQADGRVRGEPPPGLDPAERRAYAYWYGTHRKGDQAACADFDDADLVSTCAAAVKLECLHYADTYTRIDAGRAVRAPRCAIPEPPVDGFWATRRHDLLSSTASAAPDLRRAVGDDDLRACEPVFRECFR
jgi:hypothetical protein